MRYLILTALLIATPALATLPDEGDYDDVNVTWLGNPTVNEETSFDSSTNVHTEQWWIDGSDSDASCLSLTYHDDHADTFTVNTAYNPTLNVTVRTIIPQTGYSGECWGDVRVQQRVCHSNACSVPCSPICTDRTCYCMAPLEPGEGDHCDYSTSKYCAICGTCGQVEWKCDFDVGKPSTGGTADIAEE